MGVRTRVVVAIILAGGAAAALRPASAPAAALAAYLEPPAEANSGSVGLTLRSSANLGAAMRSRAWVVAGPNQPEGAALFTALPDAVLGPERVVAPAELAPTLARIHGLRWDAASASWRDPAGIRPPVALATVQEGFAAAIAMPADARAVVDLLAGQTAPGAPAVAERLVAQAEAPPRLRLVPLSGRHGQLVNADSPPPYHTVERTYEGLLLRFDGPGWPEGWRVMSLRVTGH